VDTVLDLVRALLAQDHTLPTLDTPFGKKLDFLERIQAFRIVAPEAMVRAALEKYRGTDTGSIVG
jgi:hypothetical protein